MGQARELMDRITAAVMSGDREALERLYAADAVGETPEGPSSQGSAAIIDYLLAFQRAFPDVSWEARATHECGDTAIDEGYLVGTHTEVLSGPAGDLPATGKKLRLRECDVVTVRDGVVVAHRFYYDQLEFMTQLGLTESGAAAAGADTAALPEPRAGADRPSETPIR